MLLAVKGLALTGGQPGGVEHVRELGAGVGGAVAAHQLQRGSRGAAGAGASDGQLLGGASVPAHPDPHGVQVGLWQQGDVGDEGAQQALAVAWAGGLRVPQPGQVHGEGLQRVGGRQGWLGRLRGRKRRFRLDERGQLGLPIGTPESLPPTGFPARRY
jgi:hypothetical protein